MADGYGNKIVYEKAITKILEKIVAFYNSWNNNNTIDKRGFTFNTEGNSIINFLVNMWYFFEKVGPENLVDIVDDNNKNFVKDGLISILTEVQKIRNESVRIYSIYNKNSNKNYDVTNGGVLSYVSYLKNEYEGGDETSCLKYKKNGRYISVIDEEDKNKNYSDVDDGGKNVSNVSFYWFDTKTLNRPHQYDEISIDEIKSNRDNKDRFTNDSTDVHHEEDDNWRKGCFYYRVSGEEEDDKNKLIKANDKFILLLDKIIKTVDTGINEYEHALKKYFYEELLERYRTLNIDDEFYAHIKYNEKGNVELLLPTLYNKLNGKANNINSSRIIEHSRKFKQQKETVCLFVPFDSLNFVVDGETNNDYYIQVKIKLEDLSNEQKQYLRIVEGDPFSIDDDTGTKSSSEEYLEKNTINYCRLVIFGKQIGSNSNNDELNNENMLDISKKLNNLELLASKFYVESKMLSISFKINDSDLIDKLKTSSGSSTGSKKLDLEGIIKFNYLEHKLQDNYVSNPVSSSIVVRDGYFMSKEFISTLDDRSFCLTSINKTNDTTKNLAKIYYNSDNFEYTIDVSDFSLLNNVETMTYIRFVSLKDDKEYTVPIKKVKSKLIYEKEGSVTIYNNDQYKLPSIADKSLLSSKDFTTTITLDGEFKLSLEDNRLIVNNKTELEGDANKYDDLLSVNIGNDYKLKITDDCGEFGEVKKEYVHKYLIIKRIDGFKNDEDYSEYFDYLLEKEDTISIIGFNQSQNCEFGDSYNYLFEEEN